jgi:hypothetical protein
MKLRDVDMNDITQVRRYVADRLERHRIAVRNNETALSLLNSVTSMAEYHRQIEVVKLRQQLAKLESQLADSES